MRRSSIALSVLAIGAAAASRVHAQHPTGFSIPVLASGCELCHFSHPGPGAYMLTSGDLGPAQASRLGAVSQSCLRCHLAPSTRARQSEFSGPAVLALSAGKYVGADLSSGHPIGRLDQARSLFSARDPQRAARAANTARFAVSGELAVVECTTCHDPHRRTSPVPNREEERAICAKCHDPASYAVAGHSTVACSGCHDLHSGGGGAAALLKHRDSGILCLSCHDPGRALLSGNADAALRMAPAMPVGHGRSRSPLGTGCVDCHAPHR